MSKYLAVLVIVTVFVIFALSTGVFQSRVVQEGTATSAQHPTGTSQAHNTLQANEIPQDYNTPQIRDVVKSDPYNRMALLWAVQRSGYESGPERGREIYYMKCWICHNDYARIADPSAGAPTLVGLFKRPTLMNGQPVNNDTVAAWIRTGGPIMPAFTQTGITDQDMQDLLDFLRGCDERTSLTDAGCFDAHNPPPNPRYRLPLHVFDER